MFACRANGRVVTPPFIIHQAAQTTAEMLESLPFGAMVAASLWIQ